MKTFASSVVASLTNPVSDELTIHSARVKILLTITFFFPILLCLVVLPSPASDLREHINFGLTHRLEAFAAPPLQTWLAGAVALTGARDAWLYVAVAQALNFVGLFYLVLIARRFIGEEAVVPLVLMFCGSIYYSLATPTMALNADQIQVPLWAGIAFHGLMALRDDRWSHWILCGVLIGVSVLAKYTVLLLLAVLVVALILIPEYRRVFRNSKFYAAGVCALPIIAVHALPEFYSGYSLQYAGQQFGSAASIIRRLEYLWDFVRSYVVYGAPFLAALGILAWKRQVDIRGVPAPLPQRVILLVALLYVAVIVVLILGFGLRYATRHTYPLFGLSLLALLTVIRISPSAYTQFANMLLVFWAAVIVGSLIYTGVGRHGILQEPGSAAAELLRKQWDESFSCGPAYIIGNDRSAHLIAINYGRPVLGLAVEDLPREDWFDKDQMAKFGAIVVAQADYAAGSSRFQGRELATLTLPYRRTPSSAVRTYSYYFAAPNGCPSKPAVGR